MYVLHGTWVPTETQQLENWGEFALWIETPKTLPLKKGKKKGYPYQPPGIQTETFFEQEFHLEKNVAQTLSSTITRCWMPFPAHKGAALPSLEILSYLGTEFPKKTEWLWQEVQCYRIQHPLKVLREIQFSSLYHSSILLGSDLRFWIQFARELSQLFRRQHFIPALKAIAPTPSGKTTGKKQRAKAPLAFYAGWEWASSQLQTVISEYADTMPDACRVASWKDSSSNEIWNAETLLHHFSEQALHQQIYSIRATQKLSKQLDDHFLQDCISTHGDSQNGRDIQTAQWATLETAEQWTLWKRGLQITQSQSRFVLGFRLVAPEVENEEGSWKINFFVESLKDPSLKLSLSEYWSFAQSGDEQFRKNFGDNFERNLLIQIGQAARMYPKLWDGLKTAHPEGLQFGMEEAFDFLREYAWILESSGYRVLVPAWWTPEGRLRTKLRLRSQEQKLKKQEVSSGFFALPSLVQFDYQISIGGEAVTPEEWNALLEAKTPLVRFRGQWLELDRDKMQQMLKFWEQQKDSDQHLSFVELLQKQAQEEDFEIDPADELHHVLEKLQEPGQFEAMPTPQGLQAELRDYQKRGLAWMHYLEQLRMGPCLADDMGLGKTMQVLALLVQERHENPAVPATLLIAPTSVLGNWVRESQRFAPQLRVHVHHGAERVTDSKAWAQQIAELDLLVTSYALMRKDQKLFSAQRWHRVVLDEAQNIKNPTSQQAKAVYALKAEHRIVLTGTPIENRLLDLWSIFRFLNPEYLGKQTQFRKMFEEPIQKDGNLQQAEILKRLVTPFILRRLKTDRSIIRDLPDKVEQKTYCQLTKEQASLYERVVRDVEEVMEGEEIEGIKRKGLILATLTKLKQICNHPRQFLQDNSRFDQKRSHKLKRLLEMIEESQAEGDSVLVFTQFNEIAKALDHLLRTEYFLTTYYLHGGTSRAKRDRMIETFQNEATPPAVFILSLKAGGVGITLTRANHVFHFDRWWNPAVENQATDRAFRIGQLKNVFVHKFVTIGTLEERIDQMIEEKLKLSESIVGADESWLSELDNQAFQKLIALQKEAILEE